MTDLVLFWYSWRWSSLCLPLPLSVYLSLSCDRHVILPKIIFCYIEYKQSVTLSSFTMSAPEKKSSEDTFVEVSTKKSAAKRKRAADSSTEIVNGIEGLALSQVFNSRSYHLTCTHGIMYAYYLSNRLKRDRTANLRRTVALKCEKFPSLLTDTLLSKTTGWKSSHQLWSTCNCKLDSTWRPDRWKFVLARTLRT